MILFDTTSTLSPGTHFNQPTFGRRQASVHLYGVRLETTALGGLSIGWFAKTDAVYQQSHNGRI